MARKLPDIKGAGLRKEAQWVEFYCASETKVNNLLKGKATVNGTEVTFIKARKIYGSRLVLKIANVNPSPPEEETRQELTKLLSPFVCVEKVSPVFIKAKQAISQGEELYTRRWNALVTIPEGFKLVMPSAAQVQGVTVVITWKGSQCKVCQHCKTEGHWTKECSSALRTQAIAKRMQKLPPAPLQEELNQPETTQPKPTEPQTTQKQPNTQPEPSSETKKPDTTKPTKPTAPEQKEIPKSSKARDKIAMEKSKGVLKKMGNAEETSSDDNGDDNDGFKPVVNSRRQRAKANKKRRAQSSGEEATTRNYPKGRQTRNLSETDKSVRARNRGSMTQFALHQLKNGGYDKEGAQNFLDKVTPQQFIDVTKPALTAAKYDTFSKFAMRRINSGKDDIQELARYGVSVPEYLDPANNSFVDTSVASKITERKRRRKVEPATTVESSAEEGQSTPKKDATRVKVFYKDVDGKEQSFMQTFTANQMMSTLAKRIAKVTKKTDIRLVHKSNLQLINLEITTTAAGLKHLDEIAVINPIQPHQEGVKVEIYNQHTQKTWTTWVKEDSSVVALYMSFGEA
ncbi:MAG TPA: hypothetical protein VK667_11470, partial [Ktedonobacteraceae bacterium]|nr:hypothetical protein [Ktedonobacteraceae bacterium]